MVIHTDSETAMKVATNPHPSTRSKYIDITVYWIREVIESGSLKLGFVPGDR